MPMQRTVTTSPSMPTLIVSPSTTSTTCASVIPVTGVGEGAGVSVGLGVAVSVGSSVTVGASVAVGAGVLVGSGGTVGTGIAVGDVEEQATRNERNKAQATKARTLDSSDVVN